MNKTKTIAYDLPMRVFHWLFALLFVVSFVIAEFTDDDSALYAYHMLVGFLMVFLVSLRIVWGILGTETARFTSFILRPSEVVDYFKSILNPNAKRYLGHNPASSYAAITMLFFAIGLGITGLLVNQRISKHFFEEVHELFAYGFMMTVLAHVAGVIFHQVKHKDGMISSMINGKKLVVEGSSTIPSHRSFIAVIFVGLVLTFAFYLFERYDSKTQNLTLPGLTLHLGEKNRSQEGKRSHQHRGNENEENEKHDD